jgi:hypothetical protein
MPRPLPSQKTRTRGGFTGYFRLTDGGGFVRISRPSEWVKDMLDLEKRSQICEPFGGYRWGERD